MYQINMLQYFTSYASFRCFCGVDGVADGKKQRGGAVSNTGFLGTRSDAVSFFWLMCRSGSRSLVVTPSESSS